MIRVDLTRARLIGLLCSAAALCGGCARRAIRVGSKNFTENILVAEVYASALEAACYSVERHMVLGDEGTATRALVNGTIDIYPEYIGTGFMEVLDFGRPATDDDMLGRLRLGYEKRFGATWLKPSRGVDSQGLAVQQSSFLQTLSQCGRLAPTLRLAAPDEFYSSSRRDGLEGLQTFYGGFHFRVVNARGTLRIGQQYDALRNGDADVIAISTTDPQIAGNKLRVLRDDRRFWPSYQVAPVVRLDTLAEDPSMRYTLDYLAKPLTSLVLLQMNRQVYEQGRDPADVARDLVRSLFASKSCTGQTFA